MKGNLLKLLFLCVIFISISVGRIAAQENFASPITIGQIHPLMPHYTNSQNSCAFADDIGYESGDVVYQFSVAETYSITMSMCGASYDSYLWLYDSGFNLIGSDDDGCGTAASLLTQTVTPGTYYIVCEGLGSVCGDYTLDVYANPINAGTLNVCALPHYIDSKNTCDYANEVAGGANDVIYSFALGSTQSVTMSLCNGTNYDSYLYLYDATFTQIASNDDYCGGASWLQQPLNAGTYYLVVEGFSTSCGNYTLDLAVTDLPPVLDAASLPDLIDPCEIASLLAPTATDVCAGVISGVPDVTLPVTATTTITWTFNDGGGNIVTQTQNVIINDAIPPVPDQSGFTINIYGAGTWADESSWRLEDASSAIVASGGPYASSYGTGVLIQSVPGVPSLNGPYTYFAETTGPMNDNSFTYEIICNSVVVSTGTITAGQTLSFGGILGNNLPAITEACPTVPVAPTATDNCSGIVTGVPSHTFPLSSNGTTVVTWTYTDNNGNSTTQTQNFTISDLELPTISCPSDILIDAEAIDCEGHLQEAIVYDIPYSQLTGMSSGTWCIAGVEALACGTNFGFTWNSIGATVPTSVSVEFYQIYNDNGAPLSLSVNGIGDANYAGPYVSCSPSLYTLNLNPSNINVGGVNNIGIFTPSCVLFGINPDTEWAAGSYIRVSEIYTIVDLGTPIVSDNCLITSVTNDALAEYPLGDNSITWTVTDYVGNTASCVQTLTVVDLTAPVPDVPVLTDVTSECEVLSLIDPLATDNCGTVVVTSDAVLPINTQGTTVITWTYDDGNGNISTQTQNVVITDVTAPVADVPVLADIITADCEVLSLTAPTATDNCGGSVIVTNDAVLPIMGTTTITWSYDDGNGNITTQTQNVIINDATPPVADLLTLADLTDECSVNPEPPTATDDCSGIVTGYTMTPLPVITQGTTVLTWIFEDNNGNISTQDQNVVIQDITNPEIEAPVDLLMSTDPYACEMSTPLDTAIYYIYSPQLIGMSGPTGLGCSYGTDYAVCGSAFGLSWLSNEIIDPAFVTVEIYQTYNQNSVSLPVSFNGIPDNDYIAPDGYCSTDLVTLNLSAANYMLGGMNTVSINSYSDCLVINQNPDSEWEAGAYARVIVGYPSIDAPVATDNCELVSLVNDVQPSYPIGNHTITWTATDIAGNITTVEQNLVVADLAGPIADEAVLADITSACEIASLIEPTALDYCTGPVTGVADVTLPLVETTTIHWTYTDANGNITVQEQNAVIEDNFAPVPDLAELDDIIVSCEVTTLDVPTATDNCSGLINGVHDADLPITDQGGTLVTWTYTDANGNVSTQFQVIVIMDYTGPVADVVELSEIFACGDVLALTAPTATDECSGNIVGEHNATLPLTESTLVTWSYTDNIGNVTYQDQQITITNVDETVNDNSPYLTSNQDGATYQWLDCDNSYAPIDGATSQTFFATVNGNYAVEVTLNGCTEISDCYNVTNVGIGNDVSLAYNVEVYPNPTRGTITIEMPVEGETSWRLLDVTGQIVMEGNSTEQLFNLDLEDYTPGVYMLNLIQGDINTNLRIVRK